MRNTIYTLNRKFIQEKMTERNIKSTHLDSMCGFSKGMTSRILNKKAQKFTVDTLMRISKALDSSLISLIDVEPLMQYVRYDKRKPKTFKSNG